MTVIQYSRDEQLRWEGREEEREEGIFRLISAFQDLGISESLIVSKLQHIDN